ncbi:alkaline phosphatase PafA [Flavobacteriaceae bacterium UJ101]|nr:alkaline phosphatase PafA [Flavobacteriaceae bacterium UJ101]
MKRIISLILLIVIGNSVSAQVKRPKLVVGIIVDQMRYEYLDRYYDDFSNDGFKRLLNEGYNFRNTHFNYMPTFTAPGHSSVYTGTTPAVHGIVGNSWYNKSLKKKMYCTDDASVSGLGYSGKEGKMSPRNLKATTVTDELKLATNQKGKVIGVSIKDRGAILPAGHFADAAYWMSGSGNFLTSTYYMKSFPKWATQFNQSGKVQEYINKGWDLLKDPSAYNESIADNNPYEFIFKPKTTPTFPYNLKEVVAEGGIAKIQSTPYGNDLVLDFALEAMKNEKLGKDNITDFLAISFSSTDKVGHYFGPRSMEIQDTYLRLDLNIATLLKQLDKTVGKGEYVLFLTADHAGAENPNHLHSMKYDVKNLNSKEFTTKLKTYLNNSYGYDLLENYSNQNIFLNEDLIREKKLDYSAIVDDIKHFVQKEKFVKRAYTRKEILASSPTDYHLQMIERGYDPKQNGDLVILLDPAFMEYYPTGTTHGTTYSYDTHVPNIWYGWGIKKGHTSARKEITEIAPTLSQLIHISIPNGSHGTVLQEILD